MLKASDSVFDRENVAPEVRASKAEGGLIENDWGVSPNGEGYLQRLGASGRPAIQDSDYLHLAQKVEAVNRDFAKRYGWDQPAGGGEPGSGPSTPGGSPADTALPLTTTPSKKGRPSWAVLLCKLSPWPM